MDATLAYDLIWLGEFFTEVATVVFWCLTGYNFRPVPDNPFLDMSDDEEQDDEQPDGDEGDKDTLKPSSTTIN